MNSSIAFPNLGVYFEHVGKTIDVVGFEIAFYGIVIALAMMAGIYLAMGTAKKTGQDPDDYFNLALLAIVTALIGARMYYVIFSWDYYSQHPAEVLNFRAGGLAIYGGVIGGVLGCLIYAKVKKKKFLLLLDTACPGLVLGQAIGRWGNFFNREAFGEYTNNLFAMRLPADAVRSWEITDQMKVHAETIDGTSFIQVHPTFLYESVWNIGVLIFLLFLIFKGKKKSDGEIFLWYLVLYGVGRFWIESLRTDQLLIPVIGIPVSMVLSAVFALSAAVGIWYIRKKGTQGRI